MKVLVRDAALADLEVIFAWIAKDSPATAAKVVLHILTAIERLSVLPDAGRHGRARGTLERVVTKLPYVIVYKLDWETETIHVIGVVHGARDR
jgi:toxin ParE1/3/4